MLKRQKGSIGKYQVDYKLEDFYKHYKSNIGNQVTKHQYNGFVKDLTGELMDSIVELSGEIKIPNIGYFSILGHKPNLVKKDGQLNTRALRPDWKRTWEHWYKKYEGKTQEEIIAITNKKPVYHENKHTDGVRYIFKWNNFTSVIRAKQGYKFIPSTKYKKKLNTFIKENPNHCYYGR